MSSDVSPRRGTSGLTSTPNRRAFSGWKSAFAVFSVRNYQLLFRGTFVIHIGFAMQQVAMGWLILDLSGSPFYLGLNGFFFAIPMMIVSPFGGVIADRLSRIKVLIASQSALFVFSVILAAFVYLGLATVWLLMTMSLLMGTIMAFNVPARQALVPVLVGRELVSNAIAMHSMGLNTSRIIGPALAGFLIPAVGAAGCFLLQAFGYLWSVGNVTAIRLGPQAPSEKRGSQLQDLLEGLRYCRRTGPVFTVLIMATISSVFMMPIYMTLLPAYARDTLGQDATGLGLLMSAASVGALIGSVGVAMAGRLPARGLIVLAAVIAAGVLLVVASTITIDAARNVGSGWSERLLCHRNDPKSVYYSGDRSERAVRSSHERLSGHVGHDADWRDPAWGDCRQFRHSNGLRNWWNDLSRPGNGDVGLAV